MTLTRHFLTIILLATSTLLSANVVVYPTTPEVPQNDDYRVRVRQVPNGTWLDVAVYPVKVDYVANAKHNVRVASMAYFDFDGVAEIQVIPTYTNVESARIRPLSYDIPLDIDGDTLTFTLKQPSNLSVEINGDIFRNLHLFANPIDTHKPQKSNIGKKDYIYFAPGLHKLPGDTLWVKSNTTVYIDGGARVVGQLVADNVENVKFYGRGEVHPEGRGEGISIRNSHNINVDGVIVTQIPVGGSDSIRINNVKAISSYGWGDGMNVFASNNVEYNNVFCRNSDDCHTVYATRKGFQGGSKNITMTNSTLWADVAHPIMIGLHGSATDIGPDAIPDTIQSLTYRNIDILDHCEQQIDYQGCFGISCGDNNIVKDVVFDNIRVEDFRKGQLFNVRIFHNEKYCKAPGLSIDNVLFKDINYTGSNSEMSIISGFNEDRKVSNITFENLTINEKKISDDMPGKPKWYKTGDMARIYIGNHVDGIIFK